MPVSTTKSQAVAYVNGRILAMDGASGSAAEMVVAGGRVLAVGGPGLARGLAAGMREVDLGGRTVIPGFVDAHCHLELFSTHLTYAVQCFVPPHRSIADICATLRAAAAASKQARDWVIGRAEFSVHLFVEERRPITRQDLDAVIPDRPCVVFSGMHYCTLNSRALKVTGLLDGAVLPRGSTIDLASGRGTELWDWLPLPPFGVDRVASAIRDRAADRFRSRGVTSIAEMPASREGIRAYQRLHRGGELPVRISLRYHVPRICTVDDLAAVGLEAGFGDEWHRRTAGHARGPHGGRRRAIRMEVDMGTRRSLQALGLAATGAMLAAACSSAAGTGHTAAGAASVMHLQSTTPPARGGLSSLAWDLPQGEPTTLDYAKAGDYSPDMVVENLCDDLLRLNPDFTYSPSLATSWRYVNPTTLVYTIRTGVRFWDGHPLTAADVVYSLDRNMEPSVQPVNGNFFANVKKFEQTGPYQVTVLFSHPDELFNQEMATVAGAVAEKSYMIAKGTSFGTAGGGVMCSGPFELVKWNSGTNIVLKRNPHYWDPAFEPRAQTVTLSFISDSSTLTNALLSGQLDGTFEVPPSAFPELERSAAGTLYFGPSLALEELQTPWPSGPIANPVIRQALSLSVDRAAIARGLYNGAAIPNKTLTPPTAWGADPGAVAVYRAAYDALPSTTPDLSAARRLVAGQPGTKQPIVLAIQAGDQTTLNLASLVQQAAAQIGLHVTIKQMQPLDFSNLFYLPKYRTGIGLVLANGYLDVADPLDYLTLFIGPNAVFNWIHYDSPTVQNLVNQARSTFDPVARARLITAAQKLYTSFGIVIPLLNPDEALYMRKGVTGAPSSFAYIYEPSLATVGSSA